MGVDEILSDFQRSVLLAKVIFARLPEVNVDLFQVEALQPIELSERLYNTVVCPIFPQFEFFEIIKIIDLLEVPEYLFHVTVIHRIVLREMVAAVLGGKRIKIDGLLIVNLNLGNIVHQTQYPYLRGVGR